ncbi:MAG: T9SS type A sorting domain-containing protein [Bacteroidetes bacterium]|nr:T9SS type A sorting domain-containing protein [Bacteroidota bacterium]
MIPKIQHSKDKPPAGVGGVLATQCPLIGGSAVYLARPIVELFDENIIYNDQAVCLSQGVSMKLANNNNTEAQSENSQVKVYPVPSNEVVNFDFGNIQFSMLLIFDSFGKQIQEIKLNEEHHYLLQTNTYANGIYRYKLINDKVELTGKLVILK